MWTNTRVSGALKIRVPIIQGPFGNGPSSPALVAAVTNAGGLGSYGAVQMNADQVRNVVKEIRELTQGPFSINLWVPMPGEREAKLSDAEFTRAVERLQPYYRELNAEPPTNTAPFSAQSYEALVDLSLELQVPVLSFIFGVPDRAVIEACRARGITTMGTATNVDEAVALDEAGIDLIVASGTEAGGHRASFLRAPDESPGSMALIPQTVDLVRAPVIAAGGIADGRGIAAAFALGAEGVQIGTAFLMCDQSNVTPVHRAALRNERARYTTLTAAFTGRYARSIKNRFIEEMRPHESSLPMYPIQSALTLPLRRAAIKNNDPELTNLWCGQSAALARHTDAAALMHHLIADTQRVFSRLRLA